MREAWRSSVAEGVSLDTQLQRTKKQRTLFKELLVELSNRLSVGNVRIVLRKHMLAGVLEDIDAILQSGKSCRTGSSFLSNFSS